MEAFTGVGPEASTVLVPCVVLAGDHHATPLSEVDAEVRYINHGKAKTTRPPVAVR